MDVGETAFCTSLIDFSADVIDPVYGITTSGTYFIDNGERVDPYFTTISGGYHISYPTVPSGNMVLGLMAENTASGTLYEEYEFHFGYTVEWNEVNYWGTDTLVPVFIIADNGTIAPAREYFSTFFRTHRIHSSSLSSEISLDGSGGLDIGAAIYPQHSAFVYGRTFTVTVSGIKDFSGNEIEPQIFTFTIEDEN